MTLEEFVRLRAFRAGRMQARAVGPDGERSLVSITLPKDEEEETRVAPRVEFTATARADHARVADALVRAGAQHPGLLQRSLRELHEAARTSGYVELFVDLNALKNGLVQQVARSLGRRVGRIVVSSSSIDVLHEYQGTARRHDDGSGRFHASWEMSRALLSLDELRRHVPVHIHQLPVGAARYVRRAGSEPRSDASAMGSDQEDPLTFISEDRQMIGAYWDYSARTNPRLPFHLVTSDFALAHVCAAERVPFLFAKAPREAWRQGDPGAVPRTLWFDPYALSFRACIAQAVLWELCLVFGKVNVIPDGADAGFTLHYNPREQVPGAPPSIEQLPLAMPGAVPTSTGRPAPRAKPASDSALAREPAKLKLSMATLAKVLPTHPSRERRLAPEMLSDETRGQLKQIGLATGVFVVEDKVVRSGPSLPELLAALKAKDYLGVNAIFARQPAYGQALDRVRSGEQFPSSKDGGAVTGWAVMLGAAYKSQSGVLFGLGDVTDEQFERSVRRAHSEQSHGDPAVPLADILDHVCRALQLSPIRFEFMLNKCIGQRGLLRFEVQRATVEGSVPAHPLLVVPTSDAPDAYVETFRPANGLRIGDRLVQSLVKRPGAD